MIRYKSNIHSVLGKLNKMLTPKEQDRLLLTCAQGVFASNEHRVHNEGKAVNRSLIGHYSTTPLYLNPNRSPRKFPVMGKTGRTKFISTGKMHRTRYFSDGWRGVKKETGFSSKVNLQFTGRLRADWGMLKTRHGYVIGWKSIYGKNISEGQEDRFKKTIWGITKEDRKNIEIIVNIFLKRA